MLQLNASIPWIKLLWWLSLIIDNLWNRWWNLVLFLQMFSSCVVHSFNISNRLPPQRKKKMKFKTRYYIKWIIVFKIQVSISYVPFSMEHTFMEFPFFFSFSLLLFVRFLNGTLWLSWPVFIEITFSFCFKVVISVKVF